MVMQFSGRIRNDLSFRNIGAIYVFVLVVVIFWLLVPKLFPTMETVKAIANTYSLSAIAALAVVIPLASGTFDASIGGNISLSGVMCAWLLSKTELPTAVVILATLGVGLCIAIANIIVVILIKIPSIIGTLAIWLIADALAVAVANNQTLSSTRVSGAFSYQFYAYSWGGFTIPILFTGVITIILGVILARTVAGRYIYAVGFDPYVARLAGIRVGAVQAGALVSSGLIGAFAGIVLTASVSSATPGAGDSFLLPAFAAVFVGATQFRAKRFNASGTIVAVILLGTGQYGLLLDGAPQWSPNVFQGVALIAAIGVSHLRSMRRATPVEETDVLAADAAAPPARAGDSDGTAAATSPNRP
jgi:ribose transport system permease protein